MAYGETDRLTGGSVSASSIESGSYPASYAVDNNAGTSWRPHNGVPEWIKYDFGSGTTWAIGKVRILQVSATYSINAFKIQGSNNDSDWTDLYSDNYPNSTAWQEYTWEEENDYRYIRIYVSSIDGGANFGIYEWEAFEYIAPTRGNFFLLLSEAYKRAKKLWTPDKKLILPKDLGFSY